MWLKGRSVAIQTRGVAILLAAKGPQYHYFARGIKHAALLFRTR